MTKSDKQLTEKLRKENERCLKFWKIANSETAEPEVKEAAGRVWQRSLKKVKELSKQVK